MGTEDIEKKGSSTCVFCGITSGDIPSVTVYEDATAKAFLDINPVNYGHTLVIPKEHFQWLTDTPDPVVGHVFTVAKHLSLSIQKAYDADYVALAVVGVDVPHFHVHLIPRWHSDGLANFWPTKKYKENEIEKEADTIRAHIKELQ